MKPGNNPNSLILESLDEFFFLDDAIGYYGSQAPNHQEELSGLAEHLNQQLRYGGTRLELSEDDSELALSALKYARDNIRADGIRQHIVDMLDDYESAKLVG